MGQVHPQTSLTPASGRQRQEDHSVPGWPGLHTRPCVSKTTKGSRLQVVPRSPVLAFLFNSGGRPLGQERHFVDPILYKFIREVIFGRKLELRSCLSFASNMQKSLWELSLRPGREPHWLLAVQLSLVPWCSRVPWCLHCSVQPHSSLTSQ